MFSSGNSIKRAKKVIDGLFYFAENRMLDCNQYLIHNSEDGTFSLFDAGNGLSLDGLFSGMRERDIDPEAISDIYLTHEHVDHVLGIYRFQDFSESSRPKIHAFGETARIIAEGDESKIFPGNLGIRPSMFGINIKPLDVIQLQEEVSIKIGSNFEFEIFHTPGHSRGSIVFYDKNNKILIPGDLVFSGGSFGRFDFPGGSLDELKASISFVSQLDVKYLLPGHMNITDNGNENIQYSKRMVNATGSYY